ncbi:Uncharacterised protein [Vibrio cholerae]|nr:Uncharacterised protein [Vibrio cholerae]
MSAISSPLNPPTTCKKRSSRYSTSNFKICLCSHSF